VGAPFAVVDRWTRPRLAHLALGLALGGLPFVCVTFTPAADLPQHAAQVRLLVEQLGLADETVPREEYEIRWWAPNTLVYAVLFFTCHLLGPVVGAKIGLALLALLLVAAIHDLARRRGRPPEHATLAGTLVYSMSLYWGFVGFLLGAALFLFTLERALRAPPVGGRRAVAKDVVVLAAFAAAIYAAHSLWLPFFFAALVIAPLIERRPIRRELPRLLAFAPVALHALVWFPRLRAERVGWGFDAGAHWEPLLERLNPSWAASALFGGLRGAVEPGMAVVLLLWALFCAVPPGRAGRGGVDRVLLGLSGFLAVFVGVAPVKYLNTMLFNERFAFVAGVVLLLSLPRPPVRAALSQVVTVVVAVFFAATTCAAWVAFERRDLSGLEQSLRVEPGPSSVIGLDFIKQNELLRATSFLQVFAWRQAIYGGGASFSFAEHQSGIVCMRARGRPPWTPGLEWYAEHVSLRDLTFFEHAMIVGTDEQHARFARWSLAKPLVEQGQIRLYRLAGDGGRP